MDSIKLKKALGKRPGTTLVSLNNSRGSSCNDYKENHGPSMTITTNFGTDARLKNMFSRQRRNISTTAGSMLSTNKVSWMSPKASVQYSV